MKIIILLLKLYMMSITAAGQDQPAVLEGKNIALEVKDHFDRALLTNF